MRGRFINNASVWHPILPSLAVLAIMLYFRGNAVSVYLKEPDGPASACVIWMHGLGASAQDMMGLVDMFPSTSLPIRHVFVDAPVRPVTLNNRMPMRAWYNIVGLKLTDREDRDGILQSEQITV